MALDGEGARRTGARWNSPGLPAVYTTEDPALTVLETLVHLDLTPDLIPADYGVLELALPSLTRADIKEGPDDVPNDAECRRIGDDFLKRGTALALRMTSIIVPVSLNLMLNPAHPLIGKVTALNFHPFALDMRLLRKNET